MPYPDSEYPSILRGRDKRESQRLMAAAPEMLKELKYLVEKFEEAVDWVPQYVAMADRAKAVIAKAEGRTSADA